MHLAEIDAAVKRGRPWPGFSIVHAIEHEGDVERAVVALLKDPPEPMIPTRADFFALEEIDAQRARRTLEIVLERDLAYDQPIAGEQDAQHTAALIVSALAGPTRYWTNSDIGVPGRERDFGFDPMTDRTFDVGVIAADAKEVLLVWLSNKD